MNNFLQKNSSIIVFLLFSLLCSNSIIAQYSICGYVTDNEHNPLDYFHAVLYDSKDSSLIVGGVFENGAFELSTSKTQNLYLEISYVGYSSYITSINFTNDTVKNINKIQLEPLSIDGVSIFARKPVYKRKNGKTILVVNNTSLSNIGTSIDVIKRAPGVVIDNSNNISIFGKGSPTIFIDGKEIASQQELELLQSSNIEDITIDRSPSSEYSASSTSVISIKTKKIKEDRLNIEVLEKIQIARLASNTSGISINNKYKKILNHCSYSFSNNNSKNYFEEYDNNTQDNYTIFNSSLVDDKRNDLNHNFFIGTTFDFDTLKSAGIQYRFYNNSNKMLRSSSQEIYNTSSDIVTRQIVNEIAGITEHHDISSNFHSTFKNLNSLNILLNYVNIKVKDNSQISEYGKTLQNTSNLTVDNIKDYQIYSLRTDYSFKVLNDINSKTGIKLSNILSNGTSNLTNTLEAVGFREQNVIEDFIGAGFITLEKNSVKYTLNGGMRFEVTKSNVFLNSRSIIDSSYFHIFPSLMFDYIFTENFSINVNYSKKIYRPLFSEINPTLFYIDSLSYRIGNPKLKPTFIDNVTLGIGLFKKINLSFEYNNVINDRVFVVLNDDTNPNILKSTTINIPESKRLVAVMDYNYSGKKYSIYSSVGADFSIIDIPYLDDINKIRAPMYFISINNDYTINDNILIYCNFNYLSSGPYQNIIFDESYNLSAGASFNLLQKRLKIIIEINDILRSSNMSWHSQYGNIESGQIPDYDYQSLKFTLKYNFNQFKSVFKKYSGTQEELHRL